MHSFGDIILNVLLKKFFRADFVCFDSIIIELKASKFLIEADKKQTINNVKATNFRLGLLVNFGELSLKYYRVINSHN
jgi:GxxExxY protein